MSNWRPADLASTTARGYGYPHQCERRRWAPHVERGEVDCWRCGQPIEPGTPWHLGHDDHDRSIYRGPEHPACNLRAAARASNARGHHGQDRQDLPDW